MQPTEELISGSTVYEHQGKYKVRLGVPLHSNLSQNDIDNILAVASWDVNPATHALTNEGTRGVVLKGENPSKLCGIDASFIYLSGVGWYDRRCFRPFNKTNFHPPSQQDLSEVYPDRARIVTNSFVNGGLASKPSTYSPLGTYKYKSFAHKVKSTHHLSQESFANAVVPQVDAYGFYLDDELSYDGKPFGFMAIPIPNLKVTRFSDPVKRNINRFRELDTKDPSFVSEAEKIIGDMSHGFFSLGRAIKGIHDAGFAHMQLHVGNYYLASSPIIYDWETTLELNQDGINNCLNRALDLLSGVRGIARRFDSSELTLEISCMMEAITDASLQGYFGDYGIHIDHKDKFDLNNISTTLEATVAEEMMQRGIK